jgi:hypothetical protein
VNSGTDSSEYELPEVSGLAAGHPTDERVFDLNQEVRNAVRLAGVQIGRAHV